LIIKPLQAADENDGNDRQHCNQDRGQS